MLAVLSGEAISAQHKYTVQVHDGLAFSEFSRALGNVMR
jgi:hypothetical protein